MFNHLIHNTLPFAHILGAHNSIVLHVGGDFSSRRVDCSLGYTLVVRMEQMEQEEPTEQIEPPPAQMEPLKMTPA